MIASETGGITPRRVSRPPKLEIRRISMNFESHSKCIIQEAGNGEGIKSSAIWVAEVLQVTDVWVCIKRNRKQESVCWGVGSMRPENLLLSLCLPRRKTPGKPKVLALHSKVQGKANMPLPFDFTTVWSDVVLLYKNTFTCFAIFKSAFDMLNYLNKN